jgi:hypothetical protein
VWSFSKPRSHFHISTWEQYCLNLKMSNNIA